MRKAVCRNGNPAAERKFMKENERLYDVTTIGGGPAGLSAAIYTARARYRVLVVEKAKVGGQITITSEVVNYPGVERASGTELTQAMQKQAESFGAEFLGAEVLDVELTGEIKTLHTTAGDYQALGVVLATGANPRKLGFKGEKEFQGRGVAYCATCDGEFFIGMEVFVIGGGFAAVEEGLFLTKYASRVTLIVREEDFTCAKAVSDPVWKEPKIEVKFHTEIVEVSGDPVVSRARFRDNQTGEEWTFDAGEDGGIGVFVFAGYVPNTGWLQDKVECTPQGYLVTDADQKTSIDGVYGAGDVCVKNLRQVVTAVSDGAVAATSLEKYVSAVHERQNIPDLWPLARERMEAKSANRMEAEAGAGMETEAGSRIEEGAAVRRRESGKAAGSLGGSAGAAGTGAGSAAAVGTGAGSAASLGQQENTFLSPEIRSQLSALFPKFAGRVVIRALLDDSPLAGEISGFLGELEDLTDRVTCIRQRILPEEKEARQAAGELLPAMILEREDGSGGNVIFHGVPGGHEFNSFIIALYNMAGPGQAMEEPIRQRIEAISQDVNVKVMVSLSCTMCPEVVMAVQRIAAENRHVTGEMVDLMHYPEIKKKYRIMSVPCMVVNDEQVYFGKKSLEEVTALLEKA